MKHPLNTEREQRYPCISLSAAQAIDAGASPSVEPRALVNGQSAACLWEPGDAAKTVRIGVVWPFSAPANLKALYAQRSKQAYFKETTVKGYPAVFSNVNPPGGVHCVLNVGTSDKTMFYTAAQTYGENDKQKPCEIAEQLASNVVSNLQHS